ncbi:MAG: chemotaxis protein CheC [Myxococcota bacterium]
MHTDTPRSPEVDRLCELTNIGAGHAATAFASLAGCPIRMDVPQVCGVAPADAGARTTGIFFEVEGTFSALLAIVFDASECEAVAARMLGERAGSLDAQTLESVLTELGNILASHVVSAIADTVGGRVMPSVPHLVMGNADRVLAERAAARSPLCVESVLHDENGRLGGRLVLVPEAGSLR